jgi:hypothetical protein
MIVAWLSVNRIDDHELYDSQRDFWRKLVQFQPYLGGATILGKI